MVLWCAAGDGEEDVYIAEGCEGGAAVRQREGCRVAESGGSTGWSLELCSRQPLAWTRLGGLSCVEHSQKNGYLETIFVLDQSSQ